MDERPEQRPEGALIAAALKRSRTSQRQAAAKAGISENRLRAIVHGYQSVSAGTYAAVRGPADTVARIANVAGVTPEQLEEADRSDAAEELRLLQADVSRERHIPIGQAVENNSAGPATPGTDPLAGLPEDEAERLAELSRRMHGLTRETQRIAEEIARITGGEHQRETG